MSYSLPFSIKFTVLTLVPCLYLLLCHYLSTAYAFALTSVEYLAYIEYLSEKKIEGHVEFTQSYSTNSVIFAEATKQLFILHSNNLLIIQNTKEGMFLVLESFLLKY